MVVKWMGTFVQESERSITTHVQIGDLTKWVELGVPRREERLAFWYALLARIDNEEEIIKAIETRDVFIRTDEIKRTRDRSKRVESWRAQYGDDGEMIMDSQDARDWAEYEAILLDRKN